MQFHSHAEENIWLSIAATHGTARADQVIEARRKRLPDVPYEQDAGSEAMRLLTELREYWHRTYTMHVPSTATIHGDDPGACLRAASDAFDEAKAATVRATDALRAFDALASAREDSADLTNAIRLRAEAACLNVVLRALDPDADPLVEALPMRDGRVHLSVETSSETRPIDVNTALCAAVAAGPGKATEALRRLAFGDERKAITCWAFDKTGDVYVRRYASGKVAASVSVKGPNLWWHVWRDGEATSITGDIAPTSTIDAIAEGKAKADQVLRNLGLLP